MFSKSIVKLNEEKLQEAIDYIIYHGNHSSYPFEIAEILLAIYPINNTLIAGLLSTTFVEIDLSSTDWRLQEIKDRFGIEIANIVNGVVKLSKTNYLPYNTTQAQKFFGLLFSMPEEVVTRVSFIKLSYLLHNISIFNLNPTLEQYAISALEIMEIYVPLMARIGLEEIKIELQEICLTILQPDTKEYILSHLYAILGKDVKTLMNKLISTLHNSLSAAGINAKIFGRIKTPYSIWLKMLQKNISIEQLYDILAFRIIVDNIEQCYRTLGVIHNQYPIVKGQFQDYIRLSKPNGYQSLHTVVIGPLTKNIEIQIRTQAMDNTAQHGRAAHWQYKRKPTLIKEKIYNIYRSLYQTAYLPFMNMLLTQDRDRLVKQYTHRLYKLELSKEFTVARTINSRFLLNNNTTNAYSNSHNLVLTALELNKNLDLIKRPLRSSGQTNVFSTKFINYQFIVDKFKQSYINKNLQLHEQQTEIYRDNNNNNIIVVRQLLPQLKIKIEYLEPQVEHIKPSLVQAQQIRNARYNNIKEQKPSCYAIDKMEEQEAKAELQKQSIPIEKNNIEEREDVKALQAQPKDNNLQDEGDKYDYPPLTTAASDQDLETVRSLLACPVLNINEYVAIPITGGFQIEEPIVVLVVSFGCIESAQILFDNFGADIILPCYNGQTSLMIAAQYSQVKMFKLLVEYVKDIFKNDIDGLEEFINFKNDSCYYTALDYAVDYWCSSGDPEIIYTLIALKDLEGKCLVHSYNNEGTLLTCAISHHNIGMAEELLIGSKIDIYQELEYFSTIHGRTREKSIFLFAVALGSAEMLQILLNHAKINTNNILLNQDHNDALIRAVEHNSVEVFKVLVKYYQEIGREDFLKEFITSPQDDGYDILRSAVYYYLQGYNMAGDDTRIIEILIELKDTEGKLLVHDYSRGKLIEMLDRSSTPLLTRLKWDNKIKIAKWLLGPNNIDPWMFSNPNPTFEETDPSDSGIFSNLNHSSEEPDPSDSEIFSNLEYSSEDPALNYYSISDWYG